MENKTTSNIHICAYCNKKYESDNPSSHIIPRQFFKRFKKGINNKEAYSTYFGRKTQREPKEFLLCPNCEEIFSKWETYFSSSITVKLYDTNIPHSLDVNVNAKLGALSILWRILHCWVTEATRFQGELVDKDVSFIKKYETRWLDILRQKRDFTYEEANIFVIPIDSIESNNQAFLDYKLFPGIMANAIFHDQGDGKGYYCVQCLAHKILIFAYLTKVFSIPEQFSIHNNVINTDKSTMPPAIMSIFFDYAKDALKIKI